MQLEKLKIQQSSDEIFMKMSSPTILESWDVMRERRKKKWGRFLCIYPVG